MSQPITTLVVRCSESDMTANDAATHLATSVDNARSTGRLALQKNGAFERGDATSAANDLLKLSTVMRAANETLIVRSSPEFKKSDIKSAHYSRGTTRSQQSIAVNYGSVTAAQKLGGQFFLRLEGQGQGTGELTETYSGETLDLLVAQHNKRKSAGTTQFDFVTLTVNGNVLTAAAKLMPFGTQMRASANDGATITDANFGADQGGSETQVLELERLGNIRSGVTNQVGFPIVEPQTKLTINNDYGIYTIELQRDAGHNNIVNETIKVLIRDDEASSTGGASLTVAAIESVLGLDVVDTTVPTLTSATFSVTDGTTATNSDYSVGGSSAMFVKLVGAAAAGDTVTVTVTSAETGDAGHNNVTTHTLVTATDNITLGVTANQFTASTVLTATTVITDAAGNVSATKTDTVTTAS